MNFPKCWRIMRTYNSGFSSLIRADHHRDVSPLLLLLKCLTVQLLVTVRQAEYITGSKSDVWIILCSAVKTILAMHAGITQRPQLSVSLWVQPHESVRTLLALCPYSKWWHTAWSKTFGATCHLNLEVRISEQGAHTSSRTISHTDYHTSEVFTHTNKQYHRGKQHC